MANNSNNNRMNNSSNQPSTRLFCPHCGGPIYLQDHEHFASGMAIGKDSGLGDIVLAPDNGQPISPSNGTRSFAAPVCGGSSSAGSSSDSSFGFRPKKKQDDDYIQKLRDAGIDTNDYFVVAGRGGKTQVMKYDENDIPVAVSMAEIERIIAENGMDGYVKNTRFARRFLAAYFEKARNLKGGITQYINILGYEYSLKALFNEYKTMAALETRDEACFNERKRFFTQQTLIDVIEDILHKLPKYINRLDEKKCKGRTYKVIYGKAVFCDEIQDKVIKPIEIVLAEAKRCKTYRDLMNVAKKLRSVAPSMKKSIPAVAFKEAYKAAGSFYALKNFVLYHGVFIVDEYGNKQYGDAAMVILNDKVREYDGCGWRLYAFANDVLSYNRFNLKKSIEAGNSK